MQIRTAVPADLQGIVNIEAECFPAAEAATEASLSGRLAGRFSERESCGGEKSEYIRI